MQTLQYIVYIPTSYTWICTRNTLSFLDMCAIHMNTLWKYTHYRCIFDKNKKHFKSLFPASAKDNQGNGHMFMKPSGDVNLNLLATHTGREQEEDKAILMNVKIAHI